MTANRYAGTTELTLSDEREILGLHLLWQSIKDLDHNSKEFRDGVWYLWNNIDPLRSLEEGVLMQIIFHGRIRENQLVSLNDYFLDTKVTFEKINNDGDASRLWKQMEDSGKYEWHKSPKSSSEYLIDLTTGDIYRYADHWNDVASCYWQIADNSGNVLPKNTVAIGKANIVDFEYRHEFKDEDTNSLIKEDWLEKRIDALSKNQKQNDTSDVIQEPYEIQTPNGFKRGFYDGKQFVTQTVEYFKNGAIQIRKTNIGRRTTREHFYSSGRPKAVEHFWGGKKDGKWKEWDKNGSLLNYEEWNAGTIDGFSIRGSLVKYFNNGQDAHLKTGDLIDLANKIRNQYNLATQRANATEQRIGEALVEMVKESGIEVEFISQAEAQQVAESSKVELSKGKKRVLETAYEISKDTHHSTVVSSTDGAKILKNIDTTIEKYENKDSNRTKTFIGDIAVALEAKRSGSNSEYATFETKSGRVITIRIANHNAKVSNFDNRDEVYGVSIVITNQQNVGINNDGNAHIVEFYYPEIKLNRAKDKPLVEILKSIKQALYSGEYKDTTGLAEREEVNGIEYLRTPNGIVYGFTDGKVIHLTPEGINPNTPIHEYTHLWDKVLQRANPKLWERGKALMKECPVWGEVVNDPAYADIANNEDAIASEVHSRLSGKEGERILADMAAVKKGDTVFDAAKKASLVEQIKAWLRDALRFVRDAFGKWTDADLKNLTLDEFAKMPIKDLANKRSEVREQRTESGAARFSLEDVWIADKQEYARLASVINSYGMKDVKKGMFYEAFTVDNYYIYTANKYGDFRVKLAMPIVGNEEQIGKLHDSIKNGTNRITKALVDFIEDCRNERNANNYNNATLRRRRGGDEDLASMVIRQSTNTRTGDERMVAELFEGTPGETGHAEVSPATEREEITDLSEDNARFSLPPTRVENAEGKGGEEYREAYAADLYESRMANGMVQFREAMQDSMASLSEAMKAILRAEGKSGAARRMEEIPIAENAYLGENALSSINQAEAEAVARLKFAPLMEALAKLAPKKADYQGLLDYMMAKHGLERQLYMEAKEGKHQDYAGLTGF